MSAPIYYNKMGNEGQRSYLCITSRRRTLILGWVDHTTGPVVYTADQLAGSIGKQPQGFERLDEGLVAPILLSYINDLQQRLAS